MNQKYAGGQGRRGRLPSGRAAPGEKVGGLRASKQASGRRAQLVGGRLLHLGGRCCRGCSTCSCCWRRTAATASAAAAKFQELGDVLKSAHI